MNLVLDIASSIEFWRTRYPLDRAPRPSVCKNPDKPAYRSADIQALTPKWMGEDFLEAADGVLHVLVFDREYCRQSHGIHVHAWGGPIPEGSFYELEPGVYVETPAFMFLHAATILGLSQLIAFGDELCGLYSFNKRLKRGFAKRQVALVTKEALSRFLRQAASCRGCEKAERALRYIVERSASPMETFDEMTMCLPCRYGGYNLDEPIMNHRVDLGRKAARIAKQSKCYLDMGFPEQHLDVEHHGKLDHTAYEDQASDRARVNALREEGFDVIELTSDQVGDLVAYEYIIERIARITGRRLRKFNLGATKERCALRQSVFAWNNSSGKIR